MARSLLAVFSRPQGQPLKKGPYARLRFGAEVVREAPGDPIIAEHRNHEWIADGQEFSRLDLEGGAITVRFEQKDGGASKTYGPFDVFSTVDGVAFKDRSVFASVDRQMSDWYCHDDGRHWALMIIEPAA